MNEVSPTSDRMRLAPVAISPLLDPRLGDMENDHSATKQRTLLAIAGSLLAEISLTKLLFAWFVSILLPAVLLGLAPLVLTAWIGEASDRFAEATGSARRSSFVALLAVGGSAGAHCFASRRPTSGPERAGGPARLCVLARGAPAPDRAIAQSQERRGARAHPLAQLRRGRASSFRRRGAGGLRGLASDAVDGIGGRSRLAAPPHISDDRQHSRHHVFLFSVRLARLGLRRRRRRPAARSRGRSTPPAPATASGAWRISPTCMSSASATAFASRAGAPARAATSGSYSAMERLAALHAVRAARPRADQRRYDGRRKSRRMGRVSRHPRARIPDSPPGAHSARQPRRQYRRSHQSGPSRSAVQPDQGSAQDARALGNGRRPRHAGDGLHRPVARFDPVRGAREPTDIDRGLRRQRRLPSILRARPPLA